MYRKLGIQSIQELFAKYYDNGNGNTTAETKPAASVLGTKKRKFFLIAGIAVFTVSLFCIGYYFIKPAADALPPKGVIIPLVDLALRPYSDKRYNGGNSTADVYISRETIDGETINVINIKTNLIESEVNVFAQAETRNTTVLQHLRSANGIRFKAKGDGRFWRIQLHMAGTTAKNNWASYQYTFGTIRDQVIVIDIPYYSLTFADWGANYRHYDFEKETIWLFIISANMDIQDYGPALLQIWDFEVY